MATGSTISVVAVPETHVLSTAVETTVPSTTRRGWVPRARSVRRAMRRCRPPRLHGDGDGDAAEEQDDDGADDAEPLSTHVRPVVRPAAVVGVLRPSARPLRRRGSGVGPR